MYYIFISEDKYNRECRVIPVDFSAGLDIYSDISDQLSGLDVGVLGEYAIHVHPDLGGWRGGRTK